MQLDNSGFSFAVIFDLDGTLIDSAVVILDVINIIRVERGHPKMTLELIRPHLSKGGAALVRESLGAASLEVNADLRLFRELYAQADYDHSLVYPEIRQVLGSLKRNGFKLGVCTNKPKRLCDLALAQTDLLPYFDVVFNAGEELPAKPDPAAYNHCCAALGVTSDRAVLVGDSEVDRDTAKSAGSPFILVTYGYPIGCPTQIEARARCHSAAYIEQSVYAAFGLTSPCEVELPNLRSSARIEGIQ